MKKIIRPVICRLVIAIGILFACSDFPAAQTTVPDPKYGGTRVTTTSSDLGTSTTLDEYFDNGHPPVLREKVEKTENLVEKETTVKITIYDRFARRPQPDTIIELRINGTGDTIFKETRDYIGNTINNGTRVIRLPNGQWETYHYNGKTGQFELIKPRIRRVKENGRIGYLADNCHPMEVFAGYSYLIMKLDNDNESFPAGAHAAVSYPASQRVGIVADASFHSKKDHELQITRAFLMGGIQYYLSKQQNQQMRLLARLLAGMAMDKQKYNFGMISNTDKANALALAFGLGLHHALNRGIALTLLADYIHTRFNKESQGNIRASAGININIGCK